MLISCTEKGSEQANRNETEDPQIPQDTTVVPNNLKRENGFIIYSVNLRKERLQLFWKDKNKKPFRSFENLTKELDSSNKKLLFAMNAGIFMDDENNAPLGLFVENSKTLRKINRKTGYGNFYLAPNGVFHINESHEASITPTKDFQTDENILFATQSGPMLVIDGKINPQFSAKSENKYVRNGVGIINEKELVLIISDSPISFYDFAKKFKEMDCKNALYLDGAISNYYPNSDIPLVSDFGPILGAVQK